MFKLKGWNKTGNNRYRSRSPVKKLGSSQYDAHVTKMAKVDEICKKIYEAHGDLYSPEQKRAWAHTIELEKHDSTSQPPKKHFFWSPKCSKGSSASSTCSSTSSSTSTSSAVIPTLVMSPGHRVSIRSEHTDQLMKWHSLLDCGAITKKHYNERELSYRAQPKLLRSYHTIKYPAY